MTDVTEDGSSNNEQTERKQDLSDQVSLQAKAEQSSDKTTSSSLDSVEKAGLSEENILNLSSVKEETCKTISPVKTEKSGTGFLLNIHLIFSLLKAVMPWFQ